MQSLPDALAEGERKKDQYGIWVHDTQEGFWESELPKEGVAADPLVNISEEVQDEIEALKAIYNEDRDVILTEWPPKVVVRLDEWNPSGWVVRFTLPADYPKSTPMIEMGSPSKFPQEKLEIMIAEALSCVIADSVMLYDLIESLRDQIQKYEDDVLSRVEAERWARAEKDRLRDEAKQLQEVEEEAELTRTISDTSILFNSFGIVSGDTVTDRRSVFQAHAAFVNDEKDVKEMMKMLRSNNKINRATHNIMAYRIVKDKEIAGRESEVQYCDHDSDGEHGGGSNLQNLVSMMDVRNICVVVTRWYGGVHLGPDRFKHINNCARTLLQESFPDHCRSGPGGKKSAAAKKAGYPKSK